MKIVAFSLATATTLPIPVWAQLQASKRRNFMRALEGIEDATSLSMSLAMLQKSDASKLDKMGKSGKYKGSKSGKGDKAGKCLSPGGSKDTSSRSRDEGMIECADISSSLENLASYLGSSFEGSVLDMGDAGYADARLQYASPVYNTSPTYIVEALSEIDVQATVMFAAQCDYPVTTRSGGHAYIGMSSCDGSVEACIQLDVGGINSTEVVQLPGNRGKQIRLGPGVQLRDMTEIYVQEEVLVPTGECNGIAMGGHMQTGGFGPWSRTFGVFSHYVAAFKIVLADGSLVSVTKPQTGSKTSELNDDLFYAVMGGASGSFGTVVELTLDTIDERDYFSYYWEVNFLYSDDTLPGIKNMLRKYAGLAEDPDFQNDPSWNIWWSIVGTKKMLELNPGWPGPEFNYMQFDLAFVTEKTPGLSEEDVLEESQALYESIVNECTGCVLLDDFLGPLAGAFPSVYADNRTLSQLHRDVVTFDWDFLGTSGIPFKSSMQQGRHFPSPDSLEEIVAGIDVLMPKVGTDFRLVVSQLVTAPGPQNADSKIALPFQEDVFGVTFDVWDLTGAIDYSPYQRAVQDLVITSTGGEDHRMFWSAYDDPCLECGDWEKYYESEEKYNDLKDIKTCVDPGYVFQNRMSIPPNDEI